MGYKNFVAGEEALAADVNTYLMSQTVARFATAAARASALAAPAVNQLSSRDDRPGIIERWTGSAWEAIGPDAELNYGQITAAFTVTNTSLALAQLVIDTGARVYDGSPVIAEFYSPNVLCPPAGVIYVMLFDVLTAVSTMALSGLTMAGQISVPMLARHKFTPSPGSHTYRILSYVTVPSGTINAGTGAAGSHAPAYLRITRA